MYYHLAVRRGIAKLFRRIKIAEFSESPREIGTEKRSGSNVPARCRNDGSHDRRVTIPEFRLFPPLPLPRGEMIYCFLRSEVLPNQIRARNCEDKILTPRVADFRHSPPPLRVSILYKTDIVSVCRKQASSARRSSQISSGFKLAASRSGGKEHQAKGCKLIINSRALLLTNATRQRSLNACAYETWLVHCQPVYLTKGFTSDDRIRGTVGRARAGQTFGDSCLHRKYLWATIRPREEHGLVFGIRSIPAENGSSTNLSLSLSLSLATFLTPVGLVRGMLVQLPEPPEPLKLDAPMKESQVGT